MRFGLVWTICRFWLKTNRHLLFSPKSFSATLQNVPPRFTIEMIMKKTKSNWISFEIYCFNLHPKSKLIDFDLDSIHCHLASIRLCLSVAIHSFKVASVQSENPMNNQYSNIWIYQSITLSFYQSISQLPKVLISFKRVNCRWQRRNVRWNMANNWI
jgi:hypothetical protein